MAVTGTFTVCTSMCGGWLDWADKLDKSEFSLTSPNYFATSPLRVVIFFRKQLKTDSALIGSKLCFY